jgi:hypothetical protein
MKKKPSAEYWEARCNEWMGECDRIRKQRDESRAKVKVLEAEAKAFKEDVALRIIALFREY